MKILDTGLLTVKPYLQVTAEFIGQDNGVATFKKTAHGLVNGDTVFVDGAEEDDYNGAVKITVLDADTFTYPIDERAPIRTGGVVTATRYTGFDFLIDKGIATYRKLIARTNPDNTEDIFFVKPGNQFGPFASPGDPFVLDLEVDEKEGGIPTSGNGGIGMVTFGADQTVTWAVLA